MAQLYLFLILGLFSTVSSANIKYCNVTSEVAIDTDPVKIESIIFNSYELKRAQNWIEFDFEGLTTTFFWKNEDGSKESLTEQLVKINSQLYYARIEEDDYVGFTSYLFEESGVNGLLTEDGFVSSFKCFDATREEIEKKYRFSFAPYLN